jgi:hypothetical protein
MSGSLSTLGSSNGSFGADNYSGEATIALNYSPPYYDYDSFIIGKPGAYNALAYNYIAPSGKWGTSFKSTQADSFTLSGVGYFSIGDNDAVALSDSYVFGTAISGTATWNNKTLSDLGITNLGTYVYTVGSGATTDTVTFIMGSGGGGGGTVPEPTSMAIFGLGALGFAYRNRRKLKK